MSVSTEPAAALRELLGRIAAGVGVDVDVSVREDDDVLIGAFSGEHVGSLIGRRGHTIDAIQHLAQRIVFKASTTRRVIVDADGYRERRAQVLCEEADEAADEAAASGEGVELEPMSASERRVIHEHLRDRTDVATHSEGDGADRRLVIEPSAR